MSAHIHFHSSAKFSVIFACNARKNVSSLERQWDKSIIHYILHYRQFSCRTNAGVENIPTRSMSNMMKQRRIKIITIPNITQSRFASIIQRSSCSACDYLNWIWYLDIKQFNLINYLRQVQLLRLNESELLLIFLFRICRQRLFITKWYALIKQTFIWILWSSPWIDLIWELWKEARKKAPNSQWATWIIRYKRKSYFHQNMWTWTKAKTEPAEKKKG